MKLRHIIIFLFFTIFSVTKSFAWGPEGHAIVGRLAMRFVKDDVRKNIEAILGKMSIDTAANWMDIMKSNQEYDFMRSWHYIDFPKNQLYQNSNDENIVNRLILTYNELSHKKTLCDQQIQTDLFVLLHLMGDLHMPLHTAYDDDLGGNKRIVQYDTLKTHNLHRFWDEDIIKLGNITDQDCLDLYKSFDDSLKQVDFVAWMKDSRSLLDGVYDYPGFTLDKAYLKQNKKVVEKQLLKAGLRLALILNKLFYTAAPLMNFKEVTSKYKDGIDVMEAANNMGKKVTICSRVFGIRATPTITQISVGDKYPNSPLTVVLFSKNYSKFAVPLEELLKDKNICIKGTIQEYKGKAQIIIENPEDISVL